MLDPEDLQTWVETIDQRLTVLEAESAAVYREHIHDAYEVYANMEGLPINTYVERYLDGIIKNIINELRPYDQQ